MFFVAGPIVVAASVIIVLKGQPGTNGSYLHTIKEPHLTRSPNMGTPPAR